METRLLLISHASTAAMRAARMPAEASDDNRLDARGFAEAEAARAHLPVPDDAPVLVSRAACARETAAALGVADRSVCVEAALADLDYGRWHGRSLAELASESPDEVAAWTSDPDAAPHGGESFGQLVARIGKWLDSPEGVLKPSGASGAAGRSRHIVAVTHAAVMRAAIVHALGASATVFTRIEIAPLSAVELRHGRRGWTWWPARQ